MNEEKPSEEDVMIKEMQFRDNTLELVAEHPTVAALTKELVKFFKIKGGMNYVSMKVFDPEDGEFYEVVIRKCSGKTIAEVNTEMKGAIGKIAKYIKGRRGRDKHLIKIIEPFLPKESK